AETLGTCISEPLLDGETIAARLRNLLALFVEKELVVEPFRLLRTENAADMAGQAHRIDQVLPCHLVVDAKRGPAHGPVCLPLQLAMTTGDRNLREPACLGLLVEDGAGGEVAVDDRHLKNLSGHWGDRQAGTGVRAPVRPDGRR